jgi:predicted DNA-binding transcriptional regulator YafY
VNRLNNRMARLRRLEEILLLHPRGMSAVDLGDRLEVHRRTVYRDLEFLSTEGVPLWQQDNRFGIDRTRYLTTVRLTFHEAVALTLAGLLLARTVTYRNHHITSALRRLALTLPRPLTRHLKRAASRVLTHRNDGRRLAVLETISEAWSAGQKVLVNYRSPRSGEIRQRVIAPYALEPTATGVYVIGFDDWSSDVRTFKLERLEGARILQETYEIPRDFDVERELAPSWGIMSGDDTTLVELRFSPQATPFARERIWHPSQELHEEPDGGCTLRVEVSNPLEMQPWIRSWGAGVEVRSPDWLRAQIAVELRMAAEQYEDATQTG